MSVCLGAYTANTQTRKFLKKKEKKEEEEKNRDAGIRATTFRGLSLEQQMSEGSHKSNTEIAQG